MRYPPARPARLAASGAAVVALAVAAGLSSPAAQADEATAKQLLQAMSDYLGAQEAIAFDFDVTLEVVTVDDQKLGIASSGAVTLQRPDRVHASRTGGFADVEMAFDGKTVTMLGKNANVYAQVEAPGSVEELIEVLRDQYGLPLPAADLLLTDFYGEVMPLVVDTKDLGAGVIRGVTCDHLAFRTEETDFQIWIAQGVEPYPCRYAITTRTVAGWPEYTVDIRDWKAGAAVATDGFTLAVPAGAEQLSEQDLQTLGELPGIFVRE